VFLGHFAVAFAAKKVAPGVSLGTLFIAAQLADLLWPVFFLMGLEAVQIRPGITAVTPLDFVHYPYSHSLAALLGWAIAFALVYMAGRRAPFTVGLSVAAVVLTHWVLDVIAHRPDMPITMAGSERVGLGLWNSVAGTLFVELSMFAAGVAVYLRTTTATDRVGRIALCALIAFLLVVYAASIVGPPPHSTMALAIAGFAMWLLVAWAYWADRHRRPVAPV
jgi:hypothetical protein